MKSYICLVILLSVFFYSACNSGLIEIPLEVKELKWERAIYIEEYKTIQKEAWTDEVPAAAKIISRKIIKAGTSVYAGDENYTEKETYDCTPPVLNPKQRISKTCEREVKKTRRIMINLPQDRELATYETQVWEEADKSKAFVSNGNDTQNPFWQEGKVDNKTIRLGRRTEWYSIKLARTDGEEKTYDKTASFEEFSKYKRGQKVLGKFFSKSSEPLTLEPMK